MNNENNPKVSVFMFCYNHEEYVQTAIESVLDQTYKNIELIVANNGSTDRSGEVIARYKDKIKIITLEKNNIPECVKLIFDASDGAYLAHISSDDYWYPDKLEKQIRAMQKHPECKVCFTWSEVVDNTLNNVVDNIRFRQENKNRYQWCRDMVLKQTLLEISSCVMVNGADAWKYYEDSFRFYQYPDLREHLNMVLDTEIYVVQEYLVKHRLHKGAVSDESVEGTGARSFLELNYIIKELWETMPGDYFLKAFQNELLNCNAATDAEITCEKIRLYFQLAERNADLFGEGAMEFCWKHYMDLDVAELLKDKYELPIGKIYENAKRFGDLRIKQKEIMIRQYQTIMSLEDILVRNGLAAMLLNDEQRGFLNQIFKCNQMIFSVAFDDSRQQELCDAISLSLESIRMSLEILGRLGVIASEEEFSDILSAFSEMQKSGIIDGKLSMILNYLKAFNERLQRHL